MSSLSGNGPLLSRRSFFMARLDIGERFFFGDGEEWFK